MGPSGGTPKAEGAGYSPSSPSLVGGLSLDGGFPVGAERC